MSASCTASISRMTGPLLTPSDPYTCAMAASTRRMDRSCRDVAEGLPINHRTDGAATLRLKIDDTTRGAAVYRRQAAHDAHQE
jgi:hypothetical protein